MRKFILFASLAFVIAGCSSPVLSPEDVELKGGITYEKSSDDPYTGAVIETYPDGNTRYEKHFVEGLPDGIYTRYFHNGKKSAEVTFIDGNSGGYKLWYEDGTLQAEKSDSAGMQKIVRYHSNGQKKAEQFFVKGTINQGASKTWYDNGQIETEMVFEKGKLQGPFKSWHRDGKVSIEGIYEAGDMNGEWKMYFENGNLTSVENYEKGKRIGTWKYYYETGKQRSELIYKDYLVVSKTEWDEKGKVTDRITRE
jgi:antitoxin component YwqK of YwqJK toxin-antitoxin module